MSFFGEPNLACDRAMRADNADALKACVKAGYIDASSELLDGKTVLQFCLQSVKEPGRPEGPRAPRCAAMLRGLGWTVPPEKVYRFCIG